MTGPSTLRMCWSITAYQYTIGWYRSLASAASRRSASIPRRAGSVPPLYAERPYQSGTWRPQRRPPAQLTSLGSSFELCYSESSIRAIVSAPECLPSGRSAAWLARLVRDQEAGGSNPLAPTILFILTVQSGPKLSPLVSHQVILYEIGRKMWTSGGRARA